MADLDLPTFEITSGLSGVEMNISDKDLNSKEVALSYAVKMFLTKGMDTEQIIFKTYSRGLNINDIISIVLPEYRIPKDLTRNRLIVREIKVDYSGAKAVDVITGVRYD